MCGIISLVGLFLTPLLPNECINSSDTVVSYSYSNELLFCCSKLRKKASVEEDAVFIDLMKINLCLWLTITG